MTWVELAGPQGVEFLNWMAMRGALTGRVKGVLSQLPHPNLEHRRRDNGSRK
jgi:hypothetical protein